MTDKIEQRLEEIEANVPPTITGSGKCECQACQEKLALCKALRRLLELTNGDWEFSEDGKAIRKSKPRYVVDVHADIERILSGEEGK